VRGIVDHGMIVMQGITNRCDKSGMCTYGNPNIQTNTNPIHNIKAMGIPRHLGSSSRAYPFKIQYPAVIINIIPTTANIHEAMVMQVMIPLTPYMLFLVFVNYIMI
jgi:hypothetical protein